jgi:hypothetical protein
MNPNNENNDKPTENKTFSQPMTQPQPVSSTEKTKIPNHLVMAIVSLLFFWPLSIPALINANRVNSLLLQNNMEGAKVASKRAKKWSIIAFGVWGVFVFLGILLVVLTSLVTSSERGLASQFVTDISAGNTSQAYSQFSNELKNVQTESDFDSQISSLNLDESCKFKYSGVEISSRTSSGTNAIVSGSVKCDGLTYSTTKFVYNKDKLLVEYQIKP